VANNLGCRGIQVSGELVEPFLRSIDFKFRNEFLKKNLKKKQQKKTTHTHTHTHTQAAQFATNVLRCCCHSQISYGGFVPNHG